MLTQKFTSPWPEAISSRTTLSCIRRSVSTYNKRDEKTNSSRGNSHCDPRNFSSKDFREQFANQGGTSVKKVDNKPWEGWMREVIGMSLIIMLVYLIANSLAYLFICTILQKQTAISQKILCDLNVSVTAIFRIPLISLHDKRTSLFPHGRVPTAEVLPQLVCMNDDTGEKIMSTYKSGDIRSMLWPPA